MDLILEWSLGVSLERAAARAELGLVQSAKEQVSHHRSLSKLRPWHVRAQAGHAAGGGREDKTLSRQDQLGEQCKSTQECRPVVSGTANVFTLYPAQKCASSRRKHQARQLAEATVSIVEIQETRRRSQRSTRCGEYHN